MRENRVNISQKGIELIKEYEGCKLTAYRCPAGILTIGYGHTGAVAEGQKITREQAEEFLKADLKRFEEHVESYEKYGWNQNEFDALVSFAFNVGNIRQLTANGTRSRETIAKKIVEYNKAGGRELSGLTRRRKEERELFLSEPDHHLQETPIDVIGFPVLKKGTSSCYVKILQALLNSHGYPLSADSVFGSKTGQAVISFQELEGLTKDGIVGEKTWIKLLA